MHRADDSDIADLSALRIREATFAAGVWLTYAVCAAGEGYVALTLQRPHRLLLIVLFGLGLFGALVISCLPRERIVRSSMREAFFLGWSTVDLALIALAALADGGTGSPLALVFFIPVVFAASSYPLASVAAVGSLTVAAYLALAGAAGGASGSYQALFTIMLGCTGVMSAWQARNHERQRTALAEISRTDPLTGCLNRRGFQERAAAELSAAARHARQCTVLLLDLDLFKAVNDREGHAAGDELLCWVAHTLTGALRPSDAVGRLGGDEFAVLFCDLEPALALQRAQLIAKLLGERAPASSGIASAPLDGVSLEELLRKADGRLYASRSGRSSSGRPARGSERLSWATTLARAVDLRMSEEHEHSPAVAELAVSIAAALGWKGEELGALRVAAMLHDVGKVAVPDAILRKTGPLSAEEYDTIKQHSSVGAELVSRIEDLDEVVDWIRHSHEHFDGSGYPAGLRGEQIPQASRILLVADAYDAMTSSRPYRKGLPREHALQELARNAGSQFDPACVDALLGLMRARAGAASAGAETVATARA